MAARTISVTGAPQSRAIPRGPPRKCPRRSYRAICHNRNKGVITPVMILSARAQTAEKVVGLKLGADDYVTKPFEMLELVVRVEAVLRRAPCHAPAAKWEDAS